MATSETSLENVLEAEILKRIANACEIRTHVTVETSWGRFNLGFLLTVGSRRVGLECDGGKDYTSNSGRDEFRDALILAAGGADIIYRFPGGLVWSRPADGLYVLATAEPQLFSSIGLTQLERLCTSRWDPEYEAEDIDDESLQIEENSLGFRLTYRSEDTSFYQEFLLTRNRLLSSTNKPTFLRTLAEFAKRHPGKSLRKLEQLSLKGLQ